MHFEQDTKQTLQKQTVATVNIYLNNPVGIGEHPQHLEEVDKLMAKIAEAKDKLESLKEFE